MTHNWNKNSAFKLVKIKTLIDIVSYVITKVFCLSLFVNIE